MKLLVAVLGMALVVVSAPASAEWLYQGGVEAFDGPSIHIAAIDDLSYMFAVRCRLDNIQVLFGTPDDGNADIEAQNRQSPKIRLRIDSQPIRDLPARFVARKDDVLAISNVDRDLVAAIRDAKQRVAVATSVAGRNYHEVVFPVDGSASVLGKLMSGCKL